MIKLVRSAASTPPTGVFFAVLVVIGGACSGHIAGDGIRELCAYSPY